MLFKLAYEGMNGGMNLVLSKLAHVTSNAFKMGTVMRFLSSVQVLFIMERAIQRDPLCQADTWQTDKLDIFLYRISMLLKCANTSAQHPSSLLHIPSLMRFSSNDLVIGL